jgi:hypothetical protein
MKGKLKASKPWSARTSGLGKSYLCVVRPRQTLQNGTQASDSGQKLKAPDACIRSPRHFSSPSPTVICWSAPSGWPPRSVHRERNLAQH